jgi:S-adenosyl-L-methionine hydrolase (adenosine-forming)
LKGYGMLVLFTDFGWRDPYVGQMKAVLAAQAPDHPVIDLFHDVPVFNAHAGAHLLDALARQFPTGSVFVCVVDPGVGGPRQAIACEADGRWYVGPDNGLLSVVAQRAASARYWRIDWRPETISSSFHGRDLFAPQAARLANALRTGTSVEAGLSRLAAPEVGFDHADLPRVLYIDHYGNAWTGIRAGLLEDTLRIEANGHPLKFRTVFHEAPKGEAFWYPNSVGLLEIAVNRGSASQALGLAVGDPIRLTTLPGQRAH